MLAGILAYLGTHGGAVGLAASFVTSCTRRFASTMDDDGRVKESWPRGSGSPSIGLI